MFRMYLRLVPGLCRRPDQRTHSRSNAKVPTMQRHWWQVQAVPAGHQMISFPFFLRFEFCDLLSFQGVLSTADSFKASCLICSHSKTSLALQDRMAFMLFRMGHCIDFGQNLGRRFGFDMFRKPLCLCAAALDRKLCDSGRICPSNVRLRRCASVSTMTQSSCLDTMCHTVVDLASEGSEIKN